jgi:hypothetical protein
VALGLGPARRAQDTDMGKKGKSQERLQQPPGAQEPQRIVDVRTPQDVTDTRAKNSGHGKKTADKWNQ